jgi:hypothetical protein
MREHTRSLLAAITILTIDAQILSVVGLGLVVGQVNNGAGQHVGDLRPDVNKYGLMLNFISQPVYLWAFPLVKMSVGIFLLRITPNKFYRNLLLGAMILMVYTLFCLLTIMLQCKNISFLWDFSVKTTCWPISTIMTLSYANSSQYRPQGGALLPSATTLYAAASSIENGNRNAAVNILTDLFFAFILIPMLWNIQINPRTKASLICILGLGIL